MAPKRFYDALDMLDDLLRCWDSIIPFFLAHVILALVLANASAYSPVRPLALLLIAICCLISVRSTITLLIPGQIGAEYIIGFIFHASHFLLLARVTADQRSTLKQRLQWVVDNVLFEARWGVAEKDLPPWPMTEALKLISIAHLEAEKSRLMTEGIRLKTESDKLDAEMDCLGGEKVELKGEERTIDGEDAARELAKKLGEEDARLKEEVEKYSKEAARFQNEGLRFQRATTGLTWKLAVKTQRLVLGRPKAKAVQKRLEVTPSTPFRVIPTKSEFLFQRTWMAMWSCAVIYLIQAYPMELWKDDFTAVPDGFLHRLHDVSIREMLIRTYVSTTALVVPGLTLQACHSLLSIFAVLGGSTPARWPPLFGSVRHAYTIQRFYAFTWHRLMRRAFTSHATLIVHDVLGLPRNNQFSRAVIVFLAFMISCLLHILASPDVPMKCNVWPQARYYACVGFFIVVENLFTMLIWPMIAGVHNKRSSVSSEDPKTFLHRLLGYSWVAFFEIWQCSKLLYYSNACFD